MAENRFSRKRTFKTPIAGLVYGQSSIDSGETVALQIDDFGHLITHDKALRGATTAFGEIGVTERTPIIELNPVYGFSKLRDEANNVSTGTITTFESEFILSTGTDSAGVAKLATAEIGRYVPGMGAEIGVGVRFDSTAPANGQEFIWGGLSSDDSDGLYFGYDSGGLFCAIRRKSTEEKVYRDSWNVDKLDGFGPSEFKLDLTKGHIYQIDFSWYGYGKIGFNVIGVDKTDLQSKFLCHYFSAFDRTSVATPNMKIVAKASNNGATTDFKGYVAGRQYSIEGKYVPVYRYTSERAINVSTNTTPKPLVSFKRKPNDPNKTIRLSSYDALVAAEPHFLQVYLDAELNDSTWQVPSDHDSLETGVQSNVLSDSMSNGTLVWQQLVPAAQANKSSFSAAQINFNLPSTSMLTLAARTVSGTGTVDVAALEVKEEW